MSINYSIAMLGNPIDEDAPKKAYAKSQYTNILTLDKFAGHIASHGSKYNRADIYAVLMQTVDCMREMLLEGKRIEMGDLGVFSISIQSRGAENLETFNPAIHIEQLNVNWTPGDRFRNLLEDAVFNLVPSRRAARILLTMVSAGRGIGTNAIGTKYISMPTFQKNSSYTSSTIRSLKCSRNFPNAPKRNMHRFACKRTEAWAIKHK